MTSLYVSNKYSIIEMLFDLYDNDCKLSLKYCEVIYDVLIDFKHDLNDFWKHKGINCVCKIDDFINFKITREYFIINSGKNFNIKINIDNSSLFAFKLINYLSDYKEYTYDDKKHNQLNNYEISLFNYNELKIKFTNGCSEVNISYDIVNINTDLLKDFINGELSSVIIKLNKCCYMEIKNSHINLMDYDYSIDELPYNISYAINLINGRDFAIKMFNKMEKMKKYITSKEIIYNNIKNIKYNRILKKKLDNLELCYLLS